MKPGVKIVTAAQMTALEQASEARGVSTDQLMENAGLAVAQVAREVKGSVAGDRVVVLVGSSAAILRSSSSASRVSPSSR